jgi:hypothetical protein
MNGQPRTPAGSFAAWLHLTRTAHLHDTGVDVPCGACTACCTSSYFIHVRPEETRTLSRLPDELLVAAPDLPKGHLVLGYDGSGRCPLLQDGACSIYEHRPLACRAFDCRVFAAAGIAADRPAITRRARRWAFDHSTEDDHALHAAVRAAARFVREHPECFTGGADPGTPAHVALLAIEACDVFVEASDEHGHVRRGSAAKTVAAVVEAHDAFEGRRTAAARTYYGARGKSGGGDVRS